MVGIVFLLLLMNEISFLFHIRDPCVPIWTLQRLVFSVVITFLYN